MRSYLWPGYSDDASNYHVLLIVLIANVKRREHLETWGVFSDRPADFSGLFRRILSMSLDHTLRREIRAQILSFVIQSFQSLDCSIVRKECAPLVSVSIWHNLSSQAKRDAKLDESPHLRKAWRASSKRYDSADEDTKARLRFERSWLYTLVLDFLQQMHSENSNRSGETLRAYCHEVGLTLDRTHPLLRKVHRVPLGFAEPAADEAICQRPVAGSPCVACRQALTHVQ